MDGIVCMVAWGITYGPNQTHCIRCRSNHGAFLFQVVAISNFAFLDWIYKNKNFFSSKINFLTMSLLACWIFLGFLAFNYSVTTEFVSITVPLPPRIQP